MNNMKSALLLGFIVFTFSAASRADAEADGARYFMKMYGYKNWRNAAAFSHSFASFYRVDQDQSVLRVDISWIPQDSFMPGPGDLRMPAFGDVPGQNLSVPQTIARASNAAPARTISLFGPYAISSELFYRQLEQSRRLFSGAITYRGLDMASRPVSVNCVHALADACGDFRTGIFLRGPTASSGLASFCARNGLVSSLEPRGNWSAFLDGPATRRIGCDPWRQPRDISVVDCSEEQQ